MEKTRNFSFDARWFQSLSQRTRRLFEECLLCHQSTLDGWHSNTGLLCRICHADLDLYPLGQDVFLHRVSAASQLRADQLSGLTAVSDYRWPISHWLLGLKFHGQRPAARPVADLIFAQLKHLHWPKFDYICAMPLHRKRQNERGYNQSQLLVQLINQQLRVKQFNGLSRSKLTQPQTQLNRQARLQNLKQAFCCKQPLDGKVVLLVDDVITTGVTVNEAAKCLNEAGAAAVYAAVGALSELD